MNIISKIRPFYYFLQYLWKGKSINRIHSPFVYQFIKQVLKAKKTKPTAVNQLLQYYENHQHLSIPIEQNKGEGSKVFKSKKIKIQTYLPKVSIPTKYGHILHSLVEKYEIKKVIELGTALGVSAAYMYNDNVELISIDANSDVLALTKKAMKSSGMEKVELINHFFDEVLEELCVKGLENTLIFIDGHHNKKATKRYYEIIKKHLAISSIVVLDDINWSKEMNEVWHDILEDKDVKLSIDLYRLGILFYIEEPLQKEHFTLWY